LLLLSKGGKQVGTVEEGWKEQYYCEKFDVDTPNDLTKLKDHTVTSFFSLFMVIV
jgi:CTP:molybdopterin cytidylyltransferase MocA